MSQGSGELEAIRVVLDKLHAPEGRPVEFAEVFARHAYGIDMPPLTSEEVVEARSALKAVERALSDPGPSGDGAVSGFRSD